MLLSKSAILAAQDLKHRDVEVAEWGGTVRIRCMTGNERNEYEAEVLGAHKADDHGRMAALRHKLLAFTIIDESGERVFSDADLEALGKKSKDVIERLFTVAQEVSGLGAEEGVDEGN